MSGSRLLLPLLLIACGDDTDSGTVPTDTGTTVDTEDTETEHEPNDTDTACQGAVERTAVTCEAETWTFEVLGHEDADTARVHLWDAAAGGLQASVQLEEPCPGEWTLSVSGDELSLGCGTLEMLRGAVAFWDGESYDGDSSLLNGELEPFDSVEGSWTRGVGFSWTAVMTTPATAVRAQLLSTLDGSELTEVDLVSDDQLTWTGSLDDTALGGADPVMVHTLMRAWDGTSLLVAYGL